MKTASSRALALAAIASLSLGITGCSSADKGKETVTKAADGQQQTQTTKQEPPKASEVWSKTQDRLKSYTSLTMTMAGTSAGKKMQVDVSGDTAGTKQRMDVDQDGAKSTVLTVDNKKYVKSNKKLIEETAKGQGSANSAMVSKMADKWLETGPATPSDFVLKKLQDDLTDPQDKDTKKLSANTAKVTSDTVNGKDAWKITSDQKKAIAWVSADGKYDLLKLSGSRLSESGGSSKDKIDEVTFSDYNKNFDIKKPADAKRPEDLMRTK